MKDLLPKVGQAWVSASTEQLEARLMVEYTSTDVAKTRSIARQLEQLFMLPQRRLRWSGGMPSPGHEHEG